MTKKESKITPFNDIIAKIKSSLPKDQANDLISRLQNGQEKFEREPWKINQIRDVLNSHHEAAERQAKLTHYRRLAEDSRKNPGKIAWKEKVQTVNPQTGKTEEKEVTRNSVGDINRSSLMNMGVDQMRWKSAKKDDSTSEMYNPLDYKFFGKDQQSRDENGLSSAQRKDRFISAINGSNLFANKEERRRDFEKFKRRKIGDYQGYDPVATAPADPWRYIRDLDMAQHEAELETKLQARRLFRLIDRGEDLSDEEQYEHFRELRRRQDNDGALNSVIKGAHDFHHALGKGMWSKSNPANNPKYKQYLANRKRALEDLTFKFAGGKPHLMSHLQDILSRAQNDENGMFSAETFNELSKLIAREAANGDDKKMDAIHQELNALNDAAMKDAEKYSKQSDEMWKYRILQTALLVTPFAGISLLGPVFGAVGSIMSGGFGEGLVNIMTADEFWILGDFIELIHLDDFFRWLLVDSPILGDALSLVDAVITSPIVQTAFGNAGPAIFFVAAAATGFLYTSYRIGKYEVPYFMDRSKAFKNHNKALEKKIFDIWKNGEVGQNTDFTGFAKEKTDIFAQEYQYDALRNFIEHLNKNNALNVVFNNDDIETLKQRNILHPDGTIDSKAIKDILCDLKGANKEHYQDLLDRFAVIRALTQDPEHAANLNDAIAKFAGVDKEGAQYRQLAAAGQKLINQDFYLQMANENNIKYDKSIERTIDVDARAEKIEQIKVKILKAEEGQLKQFVEDFGKDKVSYDGLDKLVKPSAVVKGPVSAESFEREKPRTPIPA